MNSISSLEVEKVQQTERAVVMDVRNITKSLPLGHERIEILKGLSFSILSGEFVSLVGPSGSGKSTLLGIIAGLDNPTSGQVLIDGIDITRMSEGKLAAIRNSKIGMVFQAFNLISTLTAQENVEVPLYVGKHQGSPSARAKELLALVGLSHRLDHRPSQLSGGEQQRLLIAQALLTDPRLLLLDEPLANLDITHSQEIVALVSEVCRARGVTVLLVSHDINPLLPVTDRVLYIAHGQSAIGTPAEVITSATLSKLYNSSVEVVQALGRLFVVGAET